MDDKSLIEARTLTQKLVSQTIKELTVSFILLIIAVALVTYFFPSVIDKFVNLGTLLSGLVLGSVIGAVRAYSIFWNKIETEYQRRERLKGRELRMESAKEVKNP